MAQHTAAPWCVRRTSPSFVLFTAHAGAIRQQDGHLTIEGGAVFLGNSASFGGKRMDAQRACFEGCPPRGRVHIVSRAIEIQQSTSYFRGKFRISYPSGRNVSTNVWLR